ncbi:NUDIX domain-containing protein [Bacillus sp. N1-1]|uniref:NUDIX domain-containing protein n=1 Tax=Bacillus sp. N1-1 TaxID=2682541 RepID=UPI0013181A38|nr:NUDIX domain-containing protein [Bacillus sp. N1-1]
MDYIQHLRSMVGHEKVIMVVAGAMVFDTENRLLLQLRTDSESWGLPGGFMDLNESVQETARREVLEETGLVLKEMSLFGIYSGSDKEKTFDNGDFH